MTRRIYRVLGLLLLPLLCAGCFTVKAFAPPDSSVRMLGPDEPIQVTKEYKSWYMFWGLLRLPFKQPHDIIAQENLIEVRFRTEDKIEDVAFGIAMALLGAPGIFPLPQTIAVEGNP